MSLSEQIQKDIVTAMKVPRRARCPAPMVKTGAQTASREMAPLDDKESQQVLTI